MHSMNAHWVPGNRITLLENGEGFYPRVFASIGAAEHEVPLETFIVFDDKVGRELQQALLSAVPMLDALNAERGITNHSRSNMRLPIARAAHEARTRVTPQPRPES